MKQKKYKIVLTGAESTGKTTLCKQLAEHYNTIWLPEFSREYIEKLGRKYAYEDVEIIARKQIERENEYLEKSEKILFVDTSLFIIKIWFLVVFEKIPDWLEKEIINNKADLYLLCNNEVAWEPDNVRENGEAERRDFLFKLYKSNLERFDTNFKIVSGIENKRFENSVNIVSENLKI